MQKDEWEYEPVSQKEAPHKIQYLLSDHRILCQREVIN